MSFSLANPKHGRVLVTGASGFVGQAVMTQLTALGSDVVGVSRRKPANAKTEQWQEMDMLSVRPADLLARTHPDVIIHCAGQGGEPRTVEERAQCWELNFALVARLLNAVSEQTSPPKIVLVSSAAIYARMTPEQTSLDETALWRPLGIYGAAKAAATMLADVMNKRGEIPVAIAVPFNLIGPGQPGHQVPQEFIDRLRSTPDRVVVGDLAAVRDWVDVRDAASALIALADEEAPTEIFNIATGRGVSVQTVLDRVVMAMGITPEVIVSKAKSAQVGTSRSVGNPSKLRKIMRLTAKYSLDESLLDMLD